MLPHRFVLVPPLLAVVLLSLLAVAPTPAAGPGGPAPRAVTNLRHEVIGTAVRLTWAAPAKSGGQVTGYEVRFGESIYPVRASARTKTIPGLRRGSTYLFRVWALNGSEANRGPEKSVRVKVPVIPPRAPRIHRAASGAPRGVVNAVANWRAPLDNGGAVINGYRVVSYQLNARGRVVRTRASALQRPTVRRAVLRLPKGRFRFAVRARNAAGWGPLSARSRTVIAR